MFRRELEKAELEIKKTAAIITEYKQVWQLELQKSTSRVLGSPRGVLTSSSSCVVSDLLPAEHQAGETAGSNKGGAGHRQGEMTARVPSYS